MNNSIEDHNNESITGEVFDIERYAVHDGPGIRTVVFLKGCPLRCFWCANPESYIIKPQLVYTKKKCIGCARCIDSCDYGALSANEEGIKIDRGKCQICHKCTVACNAGALSILGKGKTVDEVIYEVMKDELFYSDSGGGVTFSGGEPFMQKDFLLELARQSKKNLIHTSVETCGYVKWDDMKVIAPFIDLFLYDFKLMDSDKHKYFTGFHNEIILENYKNLVKMEKSIIARVPVIPGVNDYNENFEKLMKFLDKYGNSNRVDLLPYHRLGIEKYRKLEMDYKLSDIKPLTNERILEIKKLFTSNGFDVSVGG